MSKPPSHPRVTYVIADDHAFVRRGLQLELADDPSLELVGEADTGAAACELIRSARPDLALVDLRLPTLNGIGVTQAVVEAGLPTRVVIFSAFTDPALVRQAMAAGARGYLDKGSSGQVFIEALATIHAGGTFVDPSLGIDPDAADEPVLSGRERQILQLVADGRSNAEIAELLGLKLESVKTYVHRMLGKLNADSRTEAVALGLRRSLID